MGLAEKKLTKLYEAGKKQQSKIQNFARLKKKTDSDFLTLNYIIAQAAYNG